MLGVMYEWNRLEQYGGSALKGYARRGLWITGPRRQPHQ
jgi:hypothetical protein